jgi:hypothetical protein
MPHKTYIAQLFYMKCGNCGCLVFFELLQFCSHLKIHGKPPIKPGHWRWWKKCDGRKSKDFTDSLHFNSFVPLSTNYVFVFCPNLLPYRLLQSVLSKGGCLSPCSWRLRTEGELGFSEGHHRGPKTAVSNHTVLGGVGQSSNE